MRRGWLIGCMLLLAPGTGAAGKLSPSLRALLDGVAAEEQTVLLRAEVRRGQELGSVLNTARPFAVAPAGLRLAARPALATVDLAGRQLIWLEVPAGRVAAAARALADRPEVAWVERYRLRVPMNEASSWLIQSGSAEQGRSVWAHGLTGVGQVIGLADTGLDVDACQFRYSGDPASVTWALDGVQPPAALIDSPQNKIISYYVLGSAEAYDAANSGFHGTHSSGNAAGDNYAHLFGEDGSAGLDQHDGMAPGAQIVFQDIGAHDGYLMGLLGVSMYDMLEQSYRTGARVHSNSYGRVDPSPGYDLDSASIDEFIWDHNDLLAVFSAGNSGPDPSTLNGEGSTAKNTLSVGASGPVALDVFGSILSLQDDLLFFSSQGPTTDGRIKPDLVAPGMTFSATADRDTAMSQGCCDRDGNEIYAGAVDDDNCLVDTDWPAVGTSFSAPVTAGAALLVRQYYADGFWREGRSAPERGFNPTAALVKATLLAGAVPLTGKVFMAGTEAVPPPDFGQGWGRVHLEQALWFEGDGRHTLVLDDVPNPVPGDPMADSDPAPWAMAGAPLQTGDERSWLLPPLAAAGRLSLCLVWSDPPAEAGAVPALINDLDLELGAASGDVYLGNRGFGADGLAQPVQNEAPDRINNVECVFLHADLETIFEARVRAVSVPGNGMAGSDGQGFALVAAGDFLPPTPEEVEPAHAGPGATLDEVLVRGRHFQPGVSVDLGAGVTVGGIELLDPQTLRLTAVQVAADAATGPRRVVARSHHSLTAAADDLFRVSRSGCGCSAAGGLDPSLALLTLGFVLVLRRRRR